VQVVGGKAGQVFFYEKTGTPFIKDLATVLSVEGRSAKFRDRKRNTFVITAVNQDEENAISKLRRGFDVILNSYENHLISFSICDQFDSKIFQNKVQEEMAKEQIEVALAEAEMHVKNRSDNKDEVA
jgi:hypothetical protein